MLRSAVICALALLAAGCFHRKHPIASYAATPEEPAMFSAFLDELDRRCAAGQMARIGLCEKNGVEYAWEERGGVTHRERWAWRLGDGQLVWVEKRQWSDVAICLPDVLDRWGEKPPCEAVMMSACGATGDLRKRYVPAK